MSQGKRDDHPQVRVAVRLPTNPVHLDGMERLLAANGWTAASRFAPKDDDELNDRLCRGEFATVVFAEPEDAMRMIWSGHGSVSRWNAGGKAVAVEICFALAESTNGVPWPDVLQRVEQSFTQWEAGRRQRQVIAGSILTAIALIAMAVLLWMRG